MVSPGPKFVGQVMSFMTHFEMIRPANKDSHPEKKPFTSLPPGIMCSLPSFSTGLTVQVPPYFNSLHFTKRTNFGFSLKLLAGGSTGSTAPRQNSINMWIHILHEFP